MKDLLSDQLMMTCFGCISFCACVYLYVLQVDQVWENESGTNGSEKGSKVGRKMDFGS